MLTWKTRFAAATAIASGLTASAQAVVIGNVVRINGTDPVSPVVVNAPPGLISGSLAYVDRTHTWQNVPPYLNGADFVQIANDDRSAPNFQLQVTLNEPTDLYLFLDKRVNGGSADNQPTLPWMFNGQTVTFKNVGQDLGVDENNDGSINQFSRIFVAQNLSPGTYTLYQQNQGGTNMYGVAAPGVTLGEGPIDSYLRIGGIDPLEPQVHENVIGGGLREGLPAFVDRTHVLRNIPAELAGAEYLAFANDDRAASQLNVRLDLNRTSDVYLLIDDRVGDNSNTNGPSLDADTMAWVLAEGFMDTGLDVDLDEGNNGDINQFFSVFVKRNVEVGMTLLAQNDGTSRNMYGVAVVAAAVQVPEPATAMLAWGGLLSVSMMRRRRA